MATNLYTYVDRTPVRNESGIYRVYYYVNSGVNNDSKVRAFDIDVSDAREEPYKLAELLAIKYIACHTGHIGVDRDGHDLKLHVSTGAIRKVQKQSTANTDLIHHGRFLQYRFDEAVIKTARDFSWKDALTTKPVMLSVSDCNEKPIETKVGGVFLTNHAVERFMQRMNINNLSAAWRSLRKLLSNQDSVEWEVKHEPREMEKSGIDRTSEVWTLKKNSRKLLNVVIVRTQRTSRIVTVMA